MGKEIFKILDVKKKTIFSAVSQYGKFIFNEDIKKVEKFKDKIIGYCYSNEYNLIVKQLKKYKDIKLPPAICNLHIYLEHNKDKKDYSRYEHNN